MTEDNETLESEGELDATVAAGEGVGDLPTALVCEWHQRVHQPGDDLSGFDITSAVANESA